MSLNDEEIQQLELLAILRENGKLTEEQFQLQTSAILRSSAVRRSPSHPLIQRIFKRKPREVKPKIPVPKREVILERHLLPDEIQESESGIRPAVLEKDQIAKYANRKRKPSLSTLVSMRTEQEQNSNSLWATLFAVTAAVVLTSLIASSAPLEAVIERIDKRKEPTAIAMQKVIEEVKPAFLEPLFGPYAERRCRSICAGRNSQDQKYCLSSCSRFTLGEYGRRITLNPLTPDIEAREMIHTCETKPLGSRKNLPNDEWKSTVAKQVEMFRDAASKKLSKDFGSTRLRYEKTSKISNTFSSPKNNNASVRRFSENVVRAACIRAHLSLAELGINVAHENSDSFSARFYRKMYRVLQTNSMARERSIIREAKNLGVLANE